MAETEELGAKLGQAAVAGAVLLLEGELGSGKTSLARGIARGLSVPEPLTSPSFTILASYSSGRLPLFHLDLYRVSTPSDLRALDLEEIFAGAGVTVVEWPRWLLERPPAGTLEVRMEISGADERRLQFRAVDPVWIPKVAELETSARDVVVATPPREASSSG